MRPRSHLPLLATALLHACQRGAAGGAEEARLPPDWIQPVLEACLRENAGRGLPQVSEAAVLEVRDLLEAGGGGRLGAAARRELEQRPALELAAALLALLEARESAPEQKRAAAAWLEARGVAAAVPRLVLRLKYEKDWPAAVGIVRCLTRQGCGAGLEALFNILTFEGGTQEEARAAAAAALQLLPPAEGWTPGAFFAADWAHLLRVRDVWYREGRLSAAPSQEPSAADQPPDPDLAAEIWRTIAQLDSQPLRPVDDARYVLARLPPYVVPFLCEAARDRSRYVREHALETLSWMGYRSGRFALRTGFVLAGFFATAVKEPETRMQALEALGATGLPACGRLAAPWLRSPRPDEVTAAADALLRCAGPEALPEVRAALARPEALSDEARYSFALLLAELDPAAPAAQAPPTLASGERQRRERWAAERKDRPGSGAAPEAGTSR